MYRIIGSYEYERNTDVAYLKGSRITISMLRCFRLLNKTLSHVLFRDLQWLLIFRHSIICGVLSTRKNSSQAWRDRLGITEWLDGTTGTYNTAVNIDYQLHHEIKVSYTPQSAI